MNRWFERPRETGGITTFIRQGHRYHAAAILAAAVTAGKGVVKLQATTTLTFHAQRHESPHLDENATV